MIELSQLSNASKNQIYRLFENVKAGCHKQHQESLNRFNIFDINSFKSLMLKRNINSRISTSLKSSSYLITCSKCKDNTQRDASRRKQPYIRILQPFL